MSAKRDKREARHIRDTIRGARALLADEAAWWGGEKGIGRGHHCLWTALVAAGRQSDFPRIALKCARRIAPGPEQPLPLIRLNDSSHPEVLAAVDAALGGLA